ncbi:hypothetical protein MD588_04940 [Photobacterium sp. SDRW27]|uniref:hypothetical protein n=1 Tax=Photobacterium obscurum TaxID=2829490 RepID=UPI002244F115|nr:hypothetical protein [Photobacterium obscurum]MCW8328149.1 hypothetical protein [Photobacterium obscurum]
MKKLAAFCSAMLLTASFGVSAFTLEGKEVVIPQDAMKYCATAPSFWVCISDYERMKKK